MIVKIILYLCVVLSFPLTAFSKQNAVEVEIIIKDHKFIPEEIKVPAGKKIIITIHNQWYDCLLFISRVHWTTWR